MQREENNRMGKTRDPVKKIRDTKGTFHKKMGSVKNRNGKDIIEAEDKGEKEGYTHLNTEFQRIVGDIKKPSSISNAEK